MVLKPPSDGLAALTQVSPRLSYHGGEKESIGVRSNSFSRLSNRTGNDDKGIQRQEFQRPTTGNVRSRTSSCRERILSLEQDVDRLRKTLRHQEDVHRALERAFTRPLGVLPRLPSFLPQKTKQLLAEVAVLEEEVVHLEEQIVHMRQGMYQNEEHAPSSTKQKEPLGNAEQLKAKRVLRRYPSSGDLSDHVRKQGKQDYFVGSLPYSMKGSSPDRNLRTLNRVPRTHDRALETGGLHRRQLSLGSIPDTQSLFFLSQAMNGSLPFYKGLEETKALELSTEQRKSRIPIVSHEKENQLHLKSKNLHTLPPVPKGKTGAQKQSSFIRTALMETQPLTPKKKTQHTPVITHFGPTKLPSLNIFEDGKSTQQNKLSEDIVKCLMSIFLKLTRPSLATNKETPSTASRSMFSSVSPKSCGSRSTLNCKIPMEYSEEIHLKDPYGVCYESILRDIGPYKHFHDISAISFDLGRLPSCASLFRRLRFLVSKLCSADVKGLTYQQKLAFWINIYNACMMHAFLEHGIPSTPQKVVSLMRKAALNVGGQLMNALAIEHFILRPPFHSKDAYWKNGKSEEEAMMRSVYGLEWSEPLITFALCCGSWSSPAVRVYTSTEVETELEAAKGEYLQAAIGVTTERRKVLIPKLLDWYMWDFAKDKNSLLEWICEQLPISLRATVEECLRGKMDESISQVIEVLPYEFSFRYLLPL